MKKYIVETYYTCTFKTVHSLDELNEVELNKIDSRNDGEVEVIDVRLNNRKTKKFGDKSTSNNKTSKKLDPLNELVDKEIIGKNKQFTQLKEEHSKVKKYLKC